MSARASLALLTAGAILAFAVRAEPGFVDLHVTGAILMVVGLIGPAMWGWGAYGPAARRAAAGHSIEDATTTTAVPVPEAPREPLRTSGATPLRTRDAARRAG